ncbi:MAG: hypothetical protein ACI9HK_003742, partial [Pirellulaceae bacterium]
SRFSTAQSTPRHMSTLGNLGKPAVTSIYSYLGDFPMRPVFVVEKAAFG